MDPAGATTATVLGKYQIGRLLGRGNFAKVYIATSLSGDELAIKIINKSKLDPAMAPRILREVEAMRRLTRHPNILRIHEVLATKSKIHLIMDLAPAGDLFSKLCRRPNHRLHERTARRYLHQIASALQFSHRHGVAHRDLKPHNILLDGEGNVKIADFGLSAVSDDFSAEGLGLLRTGCGTPAFAAPEVFGPRRGYDGAKADAWSCGVILFTMLAGGLPFDDRNLAAMYRRMNSRGFRFPAHVTRSARVLICQLLDPNPKTRLSVDEITKSSWFNASEVSTQTLGSLSLVSSLESKFERAQSMNAFDLIGMNPGLDLSTLFDNGAANKERRFTSKEPAALVRVRLTEVGRKLGFEVEKGKSGNIWLGKGSLLVLLDVLEAAPELVMVELKVVEGDGRPEVVQWGQFRSELGDIVHFWHNQKR